MYKKKRRVNYFRTRFTLHKRSSSVVADKYETGKNGSTVHNQDTSSPVISQQILSIENFDNRGEIWNPTIPCNANCIDPLYTKDANTRQRLRKFLVKSDVMKLREITRTKFFLYTNQELALKEQRKLQCNDKIYENIMDFYNFCYRQLALMERDAFEDMQQKYNELLKMRSDKTHQMKKQNLEMEHQKLYTIVFHVYKRFRYLLKIIEYFDHVSDTCDDVAKFNRIINSPEMISLFDSLPMKHGPNEIGKLMEYLDKLIRPYLKQKTYMDSSVWERSFQAIRRKIANYNQHLTRVVLLDHLTELIYDKFMKSNLSQLAKKPFYKDTKFLRERSYFLHGTIEELLAEFERKERKDFIKPLLEGIVPIVIEKLELGTKPMEVQQEEARSIIDKLEKIQQKMMNLLYELDSLPYVLCYKIERTVRQQTGIQKIQSKEALVLRNRFQNLLDHYKYHYRIKNLGSTFFQKMKKVNKVGVIPPSKVVSSKDDARWK